MIAAGNFLTAHNNIITNNNSNITNNNNNTDALARTSAVYYNEAAIPSASDSRAALVHNQINSPNPSKNTETDRIFDDLDTEKLRKNWPFHEARHRRSPKMIDEQKLEELSDKVEEEEALQEVTDVNGELIPTLPTPPLPISAEPSRKAGSGKSAIDKINDFFNRVGRKLGFGEDCKNGGTYLISGDCACMPHFTGKLCETKTCLYGGLLQADDNCKCSNDHYKGVHCEQIVCENSGRPDTLTGQCVCVGDWYHGNFCEYYSKPWKVIFGAGGGGLILLVVLCVLCRLFIYNRSNKTTRRDRDRYDRREYNNRHHQQQQQQHHQQQQQQSIVRHNRWTHNNPSANNRHSRSQPIPPHLQSDVLTPPSRNRSVEAQIVDNPMGTHSLQLQPLIIKPPSPPPAYDDVITDTSRFRRASPPTVCAISNVIRTAHSPGTPPPTFIESQQQQQQEQQQQHQQQQQLPDLSPDVSIVERSAGRRQVQRRLDRRDFPS